MMKNQKRRGSIKTKLLAAICMLLVSSIMMVSTTYAWFTLSTAPEVKGINTAVGANGNLEMALLPKNGDVNSITSAAGDSLLAIEAKNVTWGNLVDLSDSSIYGLDAITLYPAALNGTYGTGGYLSSFTNVMLKTPVYGNDGRVATLTPNTVNGYYNATEQNFTPNDFFGVRAVGTASGMTDRQLVYRNARSTAATAAANGKTVASQSLSNNGQVLANIAVKKGTGGNEFTMADLTAMSAVVNELLGTSTTTGALEYIETAYLQYILAYAASGAIDDLDQPEVGQAYKAVQALVNAQDATLESVLAEADVSLPTQLTTAIAEFQATKAEVAEAGALLADLIELDQASYTWTEISPALYKLADPDAITVNGFEPSELLDADNLNSVISSILSGGVNVIMSTGGGVYADIADHSGDFNAGITLKDVSAAGIGPVDIPANMKTQSTQVPAYLTAISAAVEAAGAPASGNVAEQPITDMYGYIIDLAFRTNAADSKLLLQIAGADRIYSDNANEGTMGAGSNMTFTTVSSELTEAQIRELLGAIRLVFFVPGAENNTVVVNAKLDATGATFAAETGWKANLVLYKEKQVTTGDGSAAVTTIVEEAVTNDEIMALPQNTAAKLSVLVYLDGNKVGNEDVAASAAQSMVGKLNLQFASSATLVPMDYSQLHTPSTANP